MLDPLVLAGISVALAMDAFAVSMGVSAFLRRVSVRQMFRLSFHFGFFQAMMPVLGWATGEQLGDFVSEYDHWLAFVILTGLGIKMIYQSLVGRGNLSGDRGGIEGISEGGRWGGIADPTRGWSLVMLSVATSIDAYAVGLTFSLIGISVWFPAFWIGLTASFFTLLGIKIGGFVGTRFGKVMEVIGGIVLMLLGVRILLEHTIFS